MNAARWVLVGVLAGGSVGFFLGCILGLVVGGRGPCIDCQRWQALADEQDDELRAKDAELAKADRTIFDLIEQIPTTFLAGQVFQAERKDAGL